MYLRENPVLQRELLVNLRASRGFLLLLAYVGLLGVVVYLAWPQQERVNLIDPVAAKELVSYFFLGQYLLSSLMTPAFASGAISGEKERKSYEMLLASPLRPAAIVLGKLLASLTHLALLIVASLPIVLLCLPLGGVSFQEVLAAYTLLLVSVFTFGMISLACSSYFKRTAASLVVSYLLILPLALCGALFWRVFEGADSAFRLIVSVTVMPAGAALLCGSLFLTTSRRLLHPPDVGSEGKEVVDEEQELRQAVGLVIQRDHFPDRLFAPPKRTSLLPDNANPIYDKEMRSELFSQGTLMLRVVIQVSMLLAIPLMGWLLYIQPQLAAWYMSYVLLFNMLVGPVFSAGSVTSERERETLELLLVTILSPWQIMWGKLLAGLRVSSVLTSFLLWPVVLSCLMTPRIRENLLAVGAWLIVVLLTCVTTASLAMVCSVLFRKTATAMMLSYLLITLLFVGPLALDFFIQTFFGTLPVAQLSSRLTALSPFAALFNVPLYDGLQPFNPRANIWLWAASTGIYVTINVWLLALMLWLFKVRWRVAH
jgi:ABC-type transport system involved in multi-copper enzyme maturation permease subunit